MPLRLRFRSRPEADISTLHAVSFSRAATCFSNLSKELFYQQRPVHLLSYPSSISAGASRYCSTVWQHSPAPTNIAVAA